MIAKSRRSQHKREVTREPSKLILYKSINDSAHLLVLKEGYVMKPSPQQLYHRKFITSRLSLSYNGTSICWNGVVDLSKLQYPLSMLVSLQKNSVEVYPDNLNKPRRGKQLNKQCIVNFRKMRHLSSSKLQKTCQSNGCQLLGVNYETNEVMIEIPHFTKYVFSEDIEEEDLSKVLKNSQIKRSIEEFENIKTENPQQLRERSLFKIQPPNSLTQQIEEHNCRVHKHIFPYDTKTTCIPRATGININSFNRLANNLNCIVLESFQSPKQDSMKLAELVIDLSDNINAINKIVTNRHESIATRRILALYIILFRFEHCCFKFGTVYGQLQIIQSKLQPALLQKQIYIKNWFEWIISKSNLKLPNSEIYSALAKRKLSTLTERFIKYDAFDDAQFLASIEDEFYRFDTSERKICKQFHRIMIGDSRPFNECHWIVRMAVINWYYFNIDFQRERQRIFEAKVEDDQFSLEMHMFKIFYEYKVKGTVSGPLKEEEAVFWWFISTQQGDSESQLFLHESAYSKYRYRLFKALLKSAKNPKLFIKLFNLERRVKEGEKKSIIREVIRREWKSELFRNQPSLDNFITEEVALSLYTEKKYIEALEKFTQLPTDINKNETINQLAIQILEKPEVLTTYKVDEMFRIKEVLKHLSRSNANYKIHQTIISLRLAEIPFTVDLFHCIYEESIKRFCQAMRKRVMEIMFTIMGKLTDYKHYIVRNDEFYRKLLEVYRDDQAKVVLIKMARVSV